MPITEFAADLPGAGSGRHPRFVHILTTDDLAVVAAAGYLNPYIQSEGLSILKSDFVFVSAADGHQIYKPVFSGTQITLETLP
jgi:hypothetical protein